MVAALAHHSHTRTANDRLKDSFTPSIWASVILAAALHFAILAFGGAIPLPDLSPERTPPMEAIGMDLPTLPPPPEEIQRPVEPVLSVNAPADVFPPTTDQVWERITAPIDPPLPGRDAQGGIGEWVQREVEPVLRNGPEVQRLLLKSYPSVFQQSGIGGRAVFHVLVGQDGAVARAVVAETSGHPALDRAAETVVHRMRFSPALNRGEPVAVWVQIPITFQTR